MDLITVIGYTAVAVLVVFLVLLIYLVVMAFHIAYKMGNKPWSPEVTLKPMHHDRWPAIQTWNFDIGKGEYALLQFEHGWLCGLYDRLQTDVDTAPSADVKQYAVHLQLTVDARVKLYDKLLLGVADKSIDG